MKSAGSETTKPTTRQLDKKELRALGKAKRKQAKKDKHKALMAQRAAANGTSSSSSSGTGCNTATNSNHVNGTVPDIEDVVKLDPMRWKTYKPRQANPKLKPYVLELNRELESMREKCHPKILSHDAFSYATSAVLKRFNDPECRGKSELVHVYRELVKDGEIEQDQNIENMMVKKLSKSLFGGVNLSIFIPPGHTAPFWTVDVEIMEKGEKETKETKETEEEDNGVVMVRIKIIEKKSTYDLKTYASYVNAKAGATLNINDEYQVTSLKSEEMIVCLHSSSSGSKKSRKERGKHVWDLDAI